MTIIYCDRYFKRLIGLMFKKKIDRSTYYVFPKCRSVHTSFMRFSIRVLGLNEKYEIQIEHKMLPWKVKTFSDEIKHIVECHIESSIEDIETMIISIQKEKLNEEKIDT